MAESLKLCENLENGTMKRENCIFCQSIFPKRTTKATINGRKRIREVAAVKKDVVYKRLKLIGEDDFVYHVNNKCYKNYTHGKTIKNEVIKDTKHSRDKKNKTTVTSR